METKMHNLESIAAIVWTALGAVGGASKVFVQLLAMEKLPTKSDILWLLFANMFVSGFAGFLGAILATNFTTDDNIHVAVAGVAGYMGVAALDLFSLWLKNKIKK